MRLWTILALVTIACNLGASEVTLRVEPVGGHILACGRAGIRVNDACEDGKPCRQTRTINIAVDAGTPSDVNVALPGNNPATLVLDSDKCWSPSLNIEPSAATQKIVMPVWPRATVRGHITDDGKTATEQRARAEVQIGERQHAFVTATECAIAGAIWTCSVPATTIDLRIRIGDAVPFYFWNVNAQHDAITDLGKTRLDHGASIAGWVDDDSAPSATVHLVPDAVKRAETRGELRILSATPNKKGFFQFVGIPLGSYTVTATRPGRSSGTANVIVRDDREFVIRDAISLPPLVTASIHLIPPYGPDGTPWTIAVQRPIKATNFLEPVVESAADLNGVWKHEGLSAGQYRISVLDKDRSVFERKEVDLQAGIGPIDIDIHSIKISGRITAGDRAVRAKLAFSRNDGATISLESDEHGDFSGVLTRAGRWRVRAFPLGSRTTLRGITTDVKLQDGSSAAPLAITLPGGILRGRVIDENGNPTGASVRVSADGDLVADTLTDDGKFEFIGLKTGLVTLEASGKGRESGFVSYSVSDTGSDSVDLIAREVMPFKGVVLDPGGSTVAGAIVRCFANSYYGSREVIAGPSGEFTVKVPSSTTDVQLVVLAGGYPIKLATADPRQALTEIILVRSAGLLSLHFYGAPPWPSFQIGDVRVGVPAALYPHDLGPPREQVDHGFELVVAPGTYTVCGDGTPTSQCITQTVAASARVDLNVDDLAPRHPRKGGPGW